MVKTKVPILTRCSSTLFNCIYFVSSKLAEHCQILHITLLDANPVCGRTLKDARLVVSRLMPKTRRISFLNSLFLSEYSHGLIPDDAKATSSTQSQTKRIFCFTQ